MNHLHKIEDYNAFNRLLFSVRELSIIDGINEKALNTIKQLAINKVNNENNKIKNSDIDIDSVNSTNRPSSPNQAFHTPGINAEGEINSTS